MFSALPQYSLLLSLVVLLSASAPVATQNADYEFSISAGFSGAQAAIQDAPYWDYCGFDCDGEKGIYNMSSYCDRNCRYTRFGKCLVGCAPIFGPFCYLRCPPELAQATGQVQLRWGEPPAQANNESGMGFRYPDVKQFNIDEEFVIGQLTHYNYPIRIGSYVLRYSFWVELSILIRGKKVSNTPRYAFPMFVDETPNSNFSCDPAGKCPYKGTEGCDKQCPDNIIITSQVGNETFILNNVTYTLILTGFRFPNDNRTANNFTSDEMRSNTVTMYAMVTRAMGDSFCPDNRTKAVFNQNTLKYECPCVEGLCGQDQNRLPNCGCECKRNCPMNAPPVLNPKDKKKCCCDCKLGEATSCPGVRVPDYCDGGNCRNCCCKCPKDKCKFGTPMEDTVNCDCKGNHTCEENWAANPLDGNCTICTLTESDCQKGLDDYKPAPICKCVPRYTCPENFKRDVGCECACDRHKLEQTCAALKRKVLYVPYDKTRKTVGKCMCGECLDNFASPNSTGECKCNIKSCKGSAIFEEKTCQCNCPAQGPTCSGKLPIPDYAKCDCKACSTSNCTCEAGIEAKCKSLKRTTVVTKSECRCGTCWNGFTETDPSKFQTACSSCELSTEKCRPLANVSFAIFDRQNCSCVCPDDIKCPGPFDIFNRTTCTCIPCGNNFTCGNGKVEPGEQCDDPKDQCCANCLLLENVPCKEDKCSVCQRQGSVVRCVANNTICQSGECIQTKCVTRNKLPVCEVVNLDGKACGDKDLCQRRCLNGQCTDYSNEAIRNRCNNQKKDPLCGECCALQCVPATGNCTSVWKKPGSACDDRLLCTINDTCVANPNKSATPVRCEGVAKCTPQALGKKPSGWPCTEFICTSTNGDCLEVPVKGKVNCTSRKFCALNGTCSVTGECITRPKSCPSSNPCVLGRCNEKLKSCEWITDYANGLICDDRNNCTEGDACVNGECKGRDSCNSTVPGGFPIIPLIITGAVVAAAAIIAGMFVYFAIQNANIMDPVSWGEINSSQFDSNPLYQENTKFGDNPLYQS